MLNFLRRRFVFLVFIPVESFEFCFVSKKVWQQWNLKFFYFLFDIFISSLSNLKHYLFFISESERIGGEYVKIFSLIRCYLRFISLESFCGAVSLRLLPLGFQFLTICIHSLNQKNKETGRFISLAIKFYCCVLLYVYLNFFRRKENYIFFNSDFLYSSLINFLRGVIETQ